MNRAVVGIDPGSKGAMVLLSLAGPSARVIRLDYDDRKVINVGSLRWLLREPPIVFLERVMGRGGWGATQNFSFGFYYGQLVATLKQIGWWETTQLVDPGRWQTDICKGVAKVPGRGGTKVRCQRAYEALFPSDPLPRTREGTIDENVRDAMLIAAYGVWKTSPERWQEWTFPGGGPCKKNRA